MPHFMDVHTNMHGASRAMLEEAHLRDVEAQDRHGVRYVQFFHSEDSGQVFCIAEGPSAEACEAVHMEANGMQAETIIPVEPALLNHFFGGATVTDLGTTVDEAGKVDTGQRAIFFTDIVGSTRLTAELGDRAGLALVDAHDRLVGEALGRHAGRKVNHTGDGLMASFASLAMAVACGVEVQRDVAAYRAQEDALPLELRIGIHAGDPVESRGDLFGIAVNTASRICDAAGANEVFVSDIVFDRVRDEGWAIESRGERTFKGLALPIEVHVVNWDV